MARLGTLNKLASLSLLALGTALVGSGIGCSTDDDDDGTTGSDASAPDASSKADSGVTAMLSFKPSNIDLSSIDLSTIGDADITGSCQFQYGADSGIQDCASDAFAFGYLTQSDQSKVGVYVAKSIHIEPGAAVTVAESSSSRPLILVSLTTFLIQGSIDVSADDLPGGGGAGGYTYSGNSDAVGLGPGGGAAGTETQAGGGGSYCGVGGTGANVTPGGASTAGGAVYGNATLIPLVGGSTGGAGAEDPGGGGGALQLVAGTTFTLDTAGKLAAGGGPGNESGDGSQQAGGGGSGGAILIEAPTVSIAGTISANGGGGGGPGGDGTVADLPLTPAAGGGMYGGSGSAGTTLTGTAGKTPTDGSDPGAGGGGAGRIRINSSSGTATITGTFSPDATTACVTQGTLSH
jgi:hypothetical protein